MPESTTIKTNRNNDIEISFVVPERPVEGIMETFLEVAEQIGLFDGIET